MLFFYKLWLKRRYGCWEKLKSKFFSLFSDNRFFLCNSIPHCDMRIVFKNYFWSSKFPLYIFIITYENIFKSHLYRALWHESDTNIFCMIRFYKSKELKIQIRSYIFKYLFTITFLSRKHARWKYNTTICFKIIFYATFCLGVSMYQERMLTTRRILTKQNTPDVVSKLKIKCRIFVLDFTSCLPLCCLILFFGYIASPPKNNKF